MTGAAAPFAWLRHPCGGIQEIKAIATIGDDTLVMSDAADFDDTGRQLQIVTIGDFALTYWIDDADRHVKILDIRGTDR